VGRNIGTLGQAREPLDLEFSYFGATIRVHPHATDAVELEFLEAGRDLDLSELEGVDLAQVDALDPEQHARIARTFGQAVAVGARALMDALRQLVHPDDWAAYWRLGMENGQQTRDRMADIKAITSAVVEATTDFPSGRPSGSPRGRATTPPGSTAGSSSPEHPSDLEVALALERGRPDLQEFYLMQHENQTQQQREKREQDLNDQRRLAAAGLA
jgi:hypothetical protein